MHESTSDKIKKQAAIQGAGLALGAGFGAVTKKTMKTQPNQPAALASQVGSAMGAAARNGAGASGSLAAGGAIITAKVAVVATAATAAAPLVLGAAIIGGALWGAHKVLKKL